MSVAEGANLVQVLNYPAHLSQFQLYDVFARVGPIINVHRWTGTNSCQIAFQDGATAEYAVKTMNGMLCGGNYLQLAQGPYDSTHHQPTARSPLAPAPTNYSAAFAPPLASNFAKPATPALPYHQQPYFPARPSFDRRHSAITSGRLGGAGEGFENHHHRGGERVDRTNHCNAYILNLSLDMTNEELQKLCGQYGQVKHVCILATLDNAGRRRAFVDMSKPSEAQTLIRNLNGTRVHGYEIHASFAFVQRSGGPAADGQPLNRRGNGNGAGRAFGRAAHDEGSIHFGTDAIRTGAHGYGRSSSPGLRPPPLRIGGADRGRSRSPLSSGSGASVYSAPSSVDASTNGTSIECGTSVKLSNLCPVAFIDTDDVLRLLSSHGFPSLSSSQVQLEVDEVTGLSKGEALIEFGEGKDGEAEAKRCVAELEGKVCAGKTVRCEGLPASFGKLHVAA